MNRYKNKKVLITGGAGFIGSNLAIKLVELGAKVTVVDAMIKGQGGNKFNLSPVKKDIKFIRMDLKQKDKLKPLIKNQEICFNLAGSLSHVDSMTNPIEDLKINCLSQLHFLETCRLVNPDIKIVYAGTRNQYGKAETLPVREDHRIKPIDINGIHCQAAEEYHRLYNDAYGIKFCSLRLVNTFGPRHQMKHPKQGVLNWFVKQLMDDEEVKLYGGGNQLRDTNYISDVVEALLTTGVSDKVWGKVFNLGGMGISLKDFVEAYINVTGKGRYTEIGFPPDRKIIEIGDFVSDWRYFKIVTGWEPKADLEESIKETVEFYSKNKKHYWK